MPFDASIILGSKPIDTNQNALQQFLQLQQFKTQQQTNALAQQAQQLQVQQAQQEIADDQAGRNLPPGATQDQILARLGPIRGAALLKSLSDSHAAEMKLNNDRADWQGKLNNLRGHAVVGLETNLNPDNVYATINALRNEHDNEGADAISKAYYSHGLNGVGQLIQQYKSQSPEVTDETLKRETERRERDNLQRMKNRDEALGLHEANDEDQAAKNADALAAQRTTENGQKDRQIGIEQQNANTNRGRLTLEQKNAAGAADPLAGKTPGQLRVLQATARGDAAAPVRPGTKAYNDFTAGVLAIDPTWTPQRYDMKKSAKTGPDSLMYQRFGTAIEHAQRFIDNSKSLSTLGSLTSGLNITTAQRKMTLDGSLLSDEVGTMVKQGILGEAEAKNLRDNLKSPNNSVRVGAAQELKDLMAGKYNQNIYRYEVATQQPFDADTYIPDKKVQKALTDAGVNLHRDKPSGQPQAQGQQAAPSDVPAVGSKFNGGKVKSITRIQ